MQLPTHVIVGDRRTRLPCGAESARHSSQLQKPRATSLILLTAGALAGRPELGLAAVAVRTLASTLFLLARLVMAWRHSRRRGILRSWLTELPQQRKDLSLASRWFAGLPRGT